jgi:hypothetical protein
MRVISIIPAVLLAVLLAGCGAVTAETPAAAPTSATPTVDPVKKAEDDFQKALDDAEKLVRDGAGEDCQKLIEDNLKAPATAQFTGQKIRETGEYKYVVTGHVDSENGFGALVRSDYRCTIANGTVRLTKLEQRE